MTSMSTSPKSTLLRVVFDTNIYAAAALRPGQYADRWLDIAALPSSGVSLYVSPAIINELDNKLVNRFGFPPTEVRQFIERIRDLATVVSPKVRLKVVHSDPDDNAILECAVEARAQLIVTADTALLKLSPYQGIGITPPKELKRIFATDYKD